MDDLDLRMLAIDLENGGVLMVPLGLSAKDLQKLDEYIKKRIEIRKRMESERDEGKGEA